MTTNEHKVTLSDSEVIKLEESLVMMIKHCDSEITKGRTALFYSWLHSANGVKARLHNYSQMMSTSSFCRD